MQVGGPQKNFSVVTKNKWNFGIFHRYQVEKVVNGGIKLVVVFGAKNS